MRLLLLLLLLANVVLFAFEWATGGKEAGEARIRALEIAPERIQSLGLSVRSLPPPKPAVVPTAACLEWGIFVGPDIARVETMIGKLELPQPPERRVIPDSRGYWVFVPPLRTKDEVDKKVEELKAQGVTDIFVVQDASQWRNAISLGIFKTQDAAESFLGELRGKGVRTAVVERRDNFLKQLALVVREPTEATVSKLAAAQRQFPGTDIRAVACPATTGLSTKAQ